MLNGYNHLVFGVGWMGELESPTTIIGNDGSLAKEVHILGMRLVWHKGVGVSCEADPKHAEVIIRGTGAAHLSPSKLPS